MFIIKTKLVQDLLDSLLNIFSEWSVEVKRDVCDLPNCVITPVLARCEGILLTSSKGGHPPMVFMEDHEQIEDVIKTLELLQGDVSCTVESYSLYLLLEKAEQIAMSLELNNPVVIPFAGYSFFLAGSFQIGGTSIVEKLAMVRQLVFETGYDAAYKKVMTNLIEHHRFDELFQQKLAMSLSSARYDMGSFFDDGKVH